MTNTNETQHGSSRFLAKGFLAILIGGVLLIAGFVYTSLLFGQQTQRINKNKETIFVSNGETVTIGEQATTWKCVSTYGPAHFQLSDPAGTLQVSAKITFFDGDGEKLVIYTCE